jgi:hypothetical protein
VALPDSRTKISSGDNMTNAFNTIFEAIEAEDEDLNEILRDGWPCLTEDEKRLVKILNGGAGGGTSNMTMVDHTTDGYVTLSDGVLTVNVPVVT